MLQKTTTKIEVKNYPYGRLKTSMFFSLEFKPKRGFRSVRQTINPKTGVLNKPKKSTYYDVLLLDQTDGFCSFKSCEFYHIEKFNKLMQFLGENFDLFTPEEIKHLYVRAISFMKLEIRALATYCNSDVKTVIAIVDPTVKKLVEGFKSGENVFKNVTVDDKALEDSKEPDFQPFHMVERKPILLSSLSK
jgi:hypothetical protein